MELKRALEELVHFIAQEMKSVSYENKGCLSMFKILAISLMRLL